MYFVVDCVNFTCNDSSSAMQPQHVTTRRKKMNIQGLDKAAVLAALFNASRQQAGGQT